MIRKKEKERGEERQIRERQKENKPKRDFPV